MGSVNAWYLAHISNRISYFTFILRRYENPVLYEVKTDKTVPGLFMHNEGTLLLS